MGNNTIKYYQFEEFIKKRKNLISNLIGVRPKKILGYGSFGVVYNTNIDNIAIKITRHKSEIKTLLKIIELRNKGIKLPGLVNIKNIYHFNTKRKNILNCKNSFENLNLFFIIRELLYPIKNEKIINHSMPKLSSFYYPEIDLNFYKNEIGKIKKILPSLYKSLQILMDHKIYIWDINPNNMGVNNKKITVLHDIVGVEPLDEPSIQSIGEIK